MVNKMWRGGGGGGGGGGEYTDSLVYIELEEAFTI